MNLGSEACNGRGWNRLVVKSLLVTEVWVDVVAGEARELVSDLSCSE